ncbi:ankyrin repeat-containing protein ITN1-like [Diospyros lotus]|uniref:ankyrin repeat-containing protein ITN1-like n=1 Tax=Diospyros lotus TaxID=55363 RepID=UPI00224DACDB|nr:ankyrin repeat-containing protein ITN1-like [Diospyros lotus]
MEGNNITEVLERDQVELHDQLTPRKNTVLHVAAQFQDNEECVRTMLIREQSLVRQVNSKGETALHIAARRGCSVTVRVLLEFSKIRDLESDVELLRMKTLEEKDTALHEAVRNNHLGVVRLLLEEDPDLSYAAANSAGETPLYLAAERDYHEIVSAILAEPRRNHAYGGPNGRTALHAAVIAKCSNCVRNLLEKNRDLIRITDSNRWTPLHFAARFDVVPITKQLLDTDESIAHLTANDADKMTALHLAAKWGSFGMMQELWSRCPDCWEMVNERGQNVLHIAIENENSDMIKQLFKSTFPVSNLLNEKDRDGNTPLHLLATSYCNAPELIRHRAANKGAFNKKNRTPIDAIVFENANLNEENIMELINANAPLGRRNIISEDKERIEKLRRLSNEGKEKMDEQFTKVHSTIILVVTLVATVTFAASFTVPGGFDGNQGPNEGMAVLVRKAAFKAFVISNTMAVTFSISALILLLVSSNFQTFCYLWQLKEFKRFTWGWKSLVVSLVAMMVSLITGSFAVLATSMGLAVAVCVISCVGFLILCGAVGKMSHDIVIQSNIKFRMDPHYKVSEVLHRIIELFGIN